MRYALIAIFILLSASLFGQDVVKERLLGFTSYLDGVRSDSASFTYPNRHTEGGEQGAYVQGVYQYKDITFKERFSYDTNDNKRNKTIFIRKTNSVEMLIMSPDETIVIFQDYLEFHGNTEKTKYRSVKTYNENKKQLEEYFNQFVSYNSMGLVITDSLTWDYGELGLQTRSIEHFYENSVLSYSVTKDINSNHPPVLNVRVDSFAGNYQIQYSYTIRDDLYVLDEYKRIIELDERQRTILDISLNFINKKWDTTSYEELQYMETFSDGLLLESIIKNKLQPNEPFINKSRITRDYNNNNQFTTQRTYGVDSTNIWVLVQIITQEYDKLNRATKSEIEYLNYDRYSIYISSYNDKGSLSSTRYYDYGPNEYSRSTSEFYYYEPFLEESANISDFQLFPIAYPNPFSRYTRIIFATRPNQKGSISIMDMTGNIIKQNDFIAIGGFYQDIWYELSAPPGIYLVKVILGDKTKTIKLLKQ